jgi:hypothetical protein
MVEVVVICRGMFQFPCHRRDTARPALCGWPEIRTVHVRSLVFATKDRASLSGRIQRDRLGCLVSVGRPSGGRLGRWGRSARSAPTSVGSAARSGRAAREKTRRRRAAAAALSAGLRGGVAGRSRHPQQLTTGPSGSKDRGQRVQAR